MDGWERNRLTRYTYLDKDGNIQEADADLTRKRPIGSRRGTPDGGPPRNSPTFHRPRTPALEWSNFGELPAPVVTGTGSGGGSPRSGRGTPPPPDSSPRSRVGSARAGSPRWYRSPIRRPLTPPGGYSPDPSRGESDGCACTLRQTLIPLPRHSLCVPIALPPPLPAYTCAYNAQH